MSNPDPTPKSVQDAKDMKTLSDAAWLMFETSAAKYHQISLDHWQMVAGETKPDAEKLTHNAFLFYSLVLRDMSNLAMVWQKAANIGADLDLSNPKPPKQPDTGGTPPASGGTQ